MGGSCCKDVSTDSRSRRYLEREKLKPQRNEKGQVGDYLTVSPSPQHYFPMVASPQSDGAHHSNSPAAEPPTSHPQSLSSTHPKRALGGDHSYELETKPSAVVNVNTANVHELCVLKGVTPQLANSIVDYRCTRGHFRSVADLSNVPGITPEVLQAIQKKYAIECDLPQSKPKRGRKGQENNRGKSTSDHLESQPRRPGSTGKAIRIASWNLKCFSSEKAADSSVMEIVCLTILNHKLRLVAFQELGSEDALEKVCEELNHPTLVKVKSCSQKPTHWKCVVSTATGRMFQVLECKLYEGVEYNGFLWDEGAGIDLMKSGLLGKPAKADEEHFVRRPFIGVFKVDSWKFVLVSVHLKAAGWGGVDNPQLSVEIGLLSPMIQAITVTTAGQKDVIVVGDFNMSPENECFNELLESGYTYLLPPKIPTNISGQNLKGNKSYDNIWVSSEVHKRKFSGLYGVIREGLQIQTEASTVGSTGSTVSDHCPVWAEFQCPGDLCL